MNIRQQNETGPSVLPAAAFRLWHAAIAVASAAAIAAVLLENASYVFGMRQNFNCSFVDGCFQMFDPLRRWAAGQAPGHDFQFFYGLGTLWLHYLPFRLFGGSLLASEAARAFIQPLCLLIGTYAVLRTAGGKVFGLAGAAVMTVLTSRLPDMVAVNNNPMSVRSFLAVCLSAGMIVLLAHQTDGARAVRRTALVGLLAGAALFVSLDQGMAAVAAGLLTIAVCAKGNVPARLRMMAVFLASSVFTMLAVFILVSGRSFLEPLRYNLSEAAGDQFWYFGVPPSPYLSWVSFGDAWRQITGMFARPAIAVAILLVCKRFMTPPNRPAAIYLLAYGSLSLIPLLGQFQAHYMSIFWWCVAIICLIIIHDQRSLLTTLPETPRYIAAVSGLSVMLGIILFSVLTSFTDLAAAVTAPPVSVRTISGVHPNIPWRDDMDLFDGLLKTLPPSAAPLWSTYASLPEIEHGLFQPDTDYIIHALGPERRRRYIETFSALRPAIVRTTSDNWSYEHWFWNTHWDFYETLALNYDVAGHDKMMTAWTRTGREWRTPERTPWSGDLRVSADGKSARTEEVDLAPGSLATVELGYAVHNPWSWLPIFGRMPRYFAHFEGTANGQDATLSPDRTTVTLPFLAPVSSTSIDVRTDSLLPFVTVTLTSARYRIVDAGDGVKKFFKL